MRIDFCAAMHSLHIFGENIVTVCTEYGGLEGEADEVDLENDVTIGSGNQNFCCRFGKK